MTMHKPLESWKGFVENIGLMVSRPAPLQYAALCYRIADDDLKILLITSRDSRRWIIPKGWAIKNLSGSGSAAREAYEEAGAIGRIDPAPFGTYSYRKWLRGGFPVHCDVRVYSMEVDHLADAYPELDQRKRRWFTKNEAVSKVKEPQLRDLISSFSP
jgi:8-oxo-dGTP pyrophosphatase MutT (NUDIX family)